jgi:hypothetical protein
MSHLYHASYTSHLPHPLGLTNLIIFDEVVGSSEHDNGLSGSIKGGVFLD